MKAGPLVEFSPIEDSEKQNADDHEEEELMGKDRTAKSLEREFDEIAD